ncbi:MAG: hypothetical protein L3J43_05405 [Sulfurovum sp.]|nr:hypothetical protein [Sulfurovum sp.]
MVATLSNNHSIRKGTRKNIYKSALSSLYGKKKVWDQLKNERLLRQETKASKILSFTLDKKIYTIDNNNYYKVIGLENDYFIERESLSYTATSELVVQLCYYTVNGMKCKRSLLKIDSDRNEMLISESTLKRIFKPCVFEDIV